jgi:hypothetical protein
MPNRPDFDIFLGAPDRHAVWICSVVGFGNAKRRMAELAAKRAGPYFIFFAATREVVALTDSTSRLTAVVRHPQLNSALKVLRDRGHIVGRVTEIGGEPHVTIDGVPRTYEAVFELVAGIPLNGR